MKIPFYLSVFFLASIQLIITSCATVTFNVDHPPLIDLRGVNSITIVPLEWDSGRDDAYLASLVTSALLSGIKRGNVDIVDPYSLENVYLRNYSKYADVYILGRIIDVRVYDDVQRREEKIRSDTVIITSTTRTVFVDIEYTYYRSANNRILGRFNKTADNTEFIERKRYVNERRDWQDVPQSIPRQNGRDNFQRGNSQRPAERTSGRGNSGRSNIPRGAQRNRQQRDAWTNSIAASAILEFSGTMDNELNPWTTTEKRSVRGSAAGDAEAAEAKKLVRQGQYDSALDKFNAVYKKTGSVFAGYNTAVLLAANNRFTDALALLQKIDKTITETGKKSPSFIKNEISKMTGYINGFKILEGVQAIPAAQGADVLNESPPAPVTYRTVNAADEGGRIITQTTYNNKGETVSVVKNTWIGDNITSVTTTEGSNVKKTEYEYNASGGRIAQRDYNNGVLERQILTQGRREVEELYLNGVIALRAVWENGVKISEERIPAR